MNTHVSKNLEDTTKVANSWIERLVVSHTGAQEAMTVGLSGHLGAGKTAFTKLVAKSLGVKEEITSPTFVIMKIYTTNNQVFRRLVHIDAYRLERREDLEAIKLESILSDPTNLVMIEWPENVGLKDTDLKRLLKFEIKDGNYLIEEGFGGDK